MRPCVARATGLTLPPSPAPTRGFSFLTPLPFNGGNVPFYRKSMMPPLQPLVRTSENSPLETVWKIAEGVSSTLLWRQEAADRDFFDPSWPLRSPDSGSIPNFQTVSPRTRVNKGLPLHPFDPLRSTLRCIRATWYPYLACLGSYYPHHQAESALPRWLITFSTTPFGSSTKKRLTPQLSSLSGYTISSLRCTASACTASTSATSTVSWGTT